MSSRGYRGGGVASAKVKMWVAYLNTKASRTRAEERGGVG